MYVIIGATGNTGRVITEKLLGQGKKVRALGRNAEHLAGPAARGAEPFVGDVTDADAMTHAFAGAKAVYVMVPPNESTPDFYGYQNQVQDVVAAAIEKNNVKYAVLLSSVGADKPEKTGPILGLRQLEQRLNSISGLNVLSLRAAYFMENTLGETDAIKQMGYAVGPLHADLKFPMIASRDIGARAADALSNLDFVGQQVQELHGERDLTYAEVTSIIGRAIGKPDLKYVQISGQQFHGVMKQIGMSDNAAGLMVEMAAALDSGYIQPQEPRSPRNTTPTSFETFVQEEFLPAYQGKSAA